jgi:pimeloyl-ACP methyl ester carboxylesterase
MPALQSCNLKADRVVVEDHRIQTGHGALHARLWRPKKTRSEAPTIILFHDSLGSVELWRSFPAELAEATGYPVLAYDRLGFGASDANPRELDANFMRDEAQTAIPALRSQLGISRFIAFGHSVGGAMAVASAAAFPQDCVAVITEAAQAFVEDRTAAGVREAKVQFADPAQIERLARYHGDKARWVVDAWTGTWLAPWFAGWTIESLLAGGRCPVLALHGDSDEFGSEEHPRRISAAPSGKGEMLMIAKCGHVPHREQPQIVLKAVSGFLARGGL